MCGISRLTRNEFRGAMTARCGCPVALLEREGMEENAMTNFKKRSLARYGLAMLVLSGASLLVGTSPSGASDQELQPDRDCWMSMTRVCNVYYFGQCHEQPDGTSCYRCPFTFYGTANCVVRPNYFCEPSNDLPYDCGPKNVGMCVSGVCYGDIVIPDLCKLLQCVSVPS